MKYKEGNEYTWKEVKGNIEGKSFSGIPLAKVKQFYPGATYKSNGKDALCQIKGCYEKGMWLVNHKKKSILLCFNHGEDS